MVPPEVAEVEIVAVLVDEADNVMSEFEPEPIAPVKVSALAEKANMPVSAKADVV
ncbi:hypothetical protein N9W34_02530 [Rickettsiales bacterium]|nr:hypothetical protein [Rickettsiales bacterium]